MFGLWNVKKKGNTVWHLQMFHSVWAESKTVWTTTERSSKLWQKENSNTWLKPLIKIVADWFSVSQLIGSVLCVSSRRPQSVQQRCGFRKASRKPEPKKVEEPEAAIHHRTPPPHLDQQAPSGSPRPFSRLVRPFIFTVGVGGVYLSVSQMTSSVRSWTDVNAMSVYRLLLRLCGHLAVRISQVPSPELLQWYESRLAGEAATSETRRHPQTGEGRKREGGGCISSFNL